MIVAAGEGNGDAARGAPVVQPGTPLPRLALPATAGASVDLGAMTSPAVVFVYPWTGRPGHPNPPRWDDIPGAHGSTPEAEGFRDQHHAFRSLGWEVYGLSGQSRDWQLEFALRLKLPFALLSDDGFSFANALDLPRFETGGLTYLERLTLIVIDGVARETWHPVTDPAGHALQVLSRIEHGDRLLYR